MLEYLPLVVLGTMGLLGSAALLATRSPLLLALAALAGSSIGVYLANRLGVPPNLLKIYLAAMFLAGFVLLGHVPQFRTAFWEYLLLLFFLGRVLLDFTRPGFELLYPFGGVGDGIFLTAGYFYFKKAFAADPQASTSVLRAALYCCVVIGLLGIYEGVTGIDLFAFTEPRFMIEGRHRANSIFFSPEHFGAAMSLGIYLAIFLYWTSQLTRLATIGISGLLILATGASLYRGIWLACAAALFFLFLLRPGRTGSFRIPLRLFASVPPVAVLGLTIQALIRNTAVYQDRIASLENVNLRLRVYEAIVRGVVDHPWLGYGTGTVNEYLILTPYNPTILDTPHNGYLSVTFENGVVFLVIYLAWFMALLWRVCDTNRPATLVAGAMVTMVLVTNMTMYFLLAFDYHSLLVLMTAALAVVEHEAVATPTRRPIRALDRAASIA